MRESRANHLKWNIFKSNSSTKELMFERHRGDLRALLYTIIMDIIRYIP